MSQTEEKIIRTTCASHCGGTCVLRVHVKDGKITRIESDDSKGLQLRACAKGRAYRQRVYDPERLLFPLKRIGLRGEGRFERISWDEALRSVASELAKVKETYGPASIVYVPGAGDLNQLRGKRLFHKLLCLNGGYSPLWGVWSYQGGIHSAQATYGTWRTSNSRDDLTNSKLIVLWGWNPANTICGTNTSYFLAKAREKGSRTIAIDPRFTNTAAILSDQWIPIRPGTDSAMLIAMAYVIISENLHDLIFLKKYSVGFEQFRSYVFGAEDRNRKTPSWAEEITGVPAETIRNLAVEYATTKPAALLAGIAPGRSAYGEQYHRAASMLAILTGNVGNHGGDAAGRAWESASWYPYKMTYGSTFRPADGINQVESVNTDGRAQSYIPSKVHYNKLADFILKGKGGGFDAEPKMLLAVNHNFVNQLPNINKTIRALQKLDFIVALEQVMTCTAKFSDIILPTCTFLERNDIVFGVGTPFYGFVNKAIEPLGECKSHLDIACELAIYMGFDAFENKKEEELLKEMVAESEIPDYELFKKTGVYHLRLDKPYVAFKNQIEDPFGNPFDTPSGKIEIFSRLWENLENPKLPPIAKYLETWESKNDPMAQKYPLQLISSHLKRRTHSQFDRVPWLREFETQCLMMSTCDAKKRGIKDREKVRVFNDRGEIMIQAQVTERIMPGVVDLPQGAWYEPDENGVDKGGNPNVLTNDEISPGGAFPYNTCLVQIAKIEKN